MAIDAENPLGRLRWRCRRGMKELDALLVDWLDAEWAAAEPARRAAFERLLESEDSDLWRWFTGRDAPSDAAERALVESIRNARHA